MTDISGILKASFAKSESWREKELAATIKSLTKVPELMIDWDKDDGETWVRILTNGKVIAYIAVVIPIIVVISDYVKTILISINEQDCFVIEVEDFDSKTYSIEVVLIPVIEEVFRREWSAHIKPETFSINDFWWTTV